MCVFIGYRLADRDFRVVFRPVYRMGLAPGSFLVLKPPDDDELAQRQRKYLDR
jgi:hypothetical protein